MLAVRLCVLRFSVIQKRNTGNGEFDDRGRCQARMEFEGSVNANQIEWLTVRTIFVLLVTVFVTLIPGCGKRSAGPDVDGAMRAFFATEIVPSEARSFDSQANGVISEHLGVVTCSVRFKSANINVERISKDTFDWWNERLFVANGTTTVKGEQYKRFEHQS